MQDGTRDGEAIREWMHQTFIEELTAQQRPFVFLSGSWRTRFEQALESVDRLLENSELMLRGSQLLFELDEFCQSGLHCRQVKFRFQREVALPGFDLKALQLHEGAQTGE